METAEKQRQVLASNLNYLLNIKNKKQADLVRDLKIPESTLRSWFNGEKYPRLNNQQLLADYFNVPRSRITEEQNGNMERVGTIVKIPVLGTITCGDPILADENVEEYRNEAGELLPTGELFYLKTRGDSMTPTVPVDSHVLIRKQPEVEDGQIAAVLVNDDTEATLKRYKVQGDIKMLVADNSNYPPYIITPDNPARIIGKAIKVSFDL